MRTRTPSTPKSGATKRTPPQKKAAAASADEKTPETAPKSTPKATRATKGKQSASKAASTPPVAATPNPKPEVEAAEAVVTTPSSGDEKKPAKSPGKRPAAKKSPLAAKAPAAAAKKSNSSKVDQIQVEPSSVVQPEGKTEEKEEEVEEEEEKKEEAVETKLDAGSNVEEEVPETNDVNEEEDPEEESMEEDAPAPASEQEGFADPGNEELAAEIREGEDVAEGEELGVEHQDEEQAQEDAGVEVDVEMEISDMAKARKIKKEREIFVGGLDRDATEDDVKKEFERVGEVVEVRILRDFVTNKNKGFAFVKYATKEQAAKALSDLKNPTIRGKRCGIAPSEDNDTLFLGNICNTWTKEAVIIS